jgi:membrane associated rhomboid family serine protease
MSYTFTRPSLSLGTSNLLFRDIERRLYNAGYHSYNYAAQSTLNMRILYGLIGVNIGIWCYFMYTKQLAAQGHMKPITQFIQNMTMNVNDFFGRKKYWQALTSCFTHFGIGHLVFNMFSAYSLGQMVAMTPGITAGKLLTLVIGSGLTGSAGFIAQRAAKTEGGRTDRVRGLGFSGCVMGLGAAAACMHPHAQMLIMGIIPAPLWALSIGYLVYDGYYLNDQTSTTGHAGHLGGALFGMAYWYLKLRGLGRGLRM